jgi:hypothetical protein
MLKREQAYEALKAFRSADDWLERHQEAIAQLSEPLRTIAWALLDRNAAGKIDWQQGDKIHQAKIRLAEISDRERSQIFEVLFPRIADYIETSWQLQTRLPYQGNYGKPFRLPLAVEPQQQIHWIQAILRIVQEYEQGISWYAVWGAHVWQQDVLGILLAAAIEGGGDVGEEVFNTLLTSARGEHEIGAMGKHVTRALLVASRPEGWTFIENLLIAAQRQEGLRQAILETIDEAHPAAFRRMVRLILERDLLRFSATMRAVEKWFSLGWDVSYKKIAEQALRIVLSCLEDANALESSLKSADPQEVYLALWAIAFDNALEAIAPATELLQHERVEMRFVAAFLLNQLQLDPARQALVPVLTDPDLRVAAQAFYSISNDTSRASTDLFERIEAFLQRVPTQTKQLQPLIWDWMVLTLDREYVVNSLVNLLGDRSPRILIPYLPEMADWQRLQVISLLAKAQPWDLEVQEIIFATAGDRSSYARKQTFDLLNKYSLTPEFVMRFEALLTRKSGDLRREVLNLLLRQADAATLSSAERILGSTNASQRAAGLELLDEMVRAKRSAQDCYAMVEAYRSQRVKRTAAEDELLQKFSEPSQQETPTPENGFGLFDPAQRTPAIPPEFPDREVILITDTARNLLRSLDDLIHEHRATPFRWKSWNGNEGEEQLLGNTNWLGTPWQHGEVHNLDALPLAAVWQTWWEERPAELRDPDDLELLRAAVAIGSFGVMDFFQYGSFCRWYDFDDFGDRIPRWVKDLSQRLVASVEELKYPTLVRSLMGWLIFLYPPFNIADFALDAAQYSLAIIRETISQQIAQTSASSELPGEAKAESELDVNLNLISMLAQMGIPPEIANQFATMESDLASILPPEAYESMMLIQDMVGQADGESDTFDWRENGQLTAWITLACQQYSTNSNTWTQLQVERLWNLLRWIDEPVGTVPRWLPTEQGSFQILPIQNRTSGGSIQRCRPSLVQLLRGFDAGVVTETDILDYLIGRQHGYRYPELSELTQRNRDRAESHYISTTNPNYPYLMALVDRCRDRILEIEYARGDLPTPATEAALSLKSVIGIPPVIKLLQNLGKEQFARGWNYDRSSKASTFSHLLRVSFPATTDTPEDFAQQVRASDLSEQRLIELALFAPQWSRYVEQALKWPAFAEAVWWFHAHTKDSHWEVEQSIREGWTAQVTEHTPLTSQDLLDGAVDVAWFWRVYRAMRPEQWEAIHEAAKFAAGGQGHQRARLFADAMLSKIDKSDSIKRIQSKRHQDSVRALGLIPLVKGKKRAADLLERYEVVQEFLRASKQFGSQRQASEKLAVRIALENLARTAGYADPQRLEWAMEARAIADLGKGAVVITEGDVTISLSLDESGTPHLGVAKKGKSQKTIPAALKKKPEIVALQERKQKLSQQSSRMRISLEQAMCRGDRFTGAELRQLLAHPILRPMLQNLLFIGEEVIGYPSTDGSGLQNYDRSIAALDDATTVQIAHPTDLVKTGVWHLWQQECFDRERSQPFKQIFRELYVPIATEQTERKGSRRYAGHQVNPRQATALFGQRGWLTGSSYDYDSDIHRVFYDEDIAVYLNVDRGWSTPADVEGLTIDEVSFSHRNRGGTLALDAVPPRVFSEVMRDLDLVVSVAHQGGVDPEVSASTVEMRSALVRETNRLLKLSNVSLQNSYALIEGELGSYSVHLGSGVVHRQPGGSLCIIPVHGQHRGRLFLPFADDDPKTAEIVSKILLLAKDREIQDPTILQQIL